jgi:predicted dehydrogenase
MHAHAFSIREGQNEMVDSSVRVALVGAGAMANRFHYPSLASLPNVELVGISDFIEPKARETAERFEIPLDRVYTDYREMISDVRPQVVYVLMPPQHLYEPVHHILQHGCHVFVEKPLGLTVGQARMLSHTAEENGCLTMVGFQRRFSPAMTSIRQQVEVRGPIHFAEVEFLKSTADLTSPAGFYDGAIDPLTSDGVHAVDLVRWLCGGDVEEVHAVGRRRGVPGPVPNAFTAHITFSTGAVGFVQYNQFTGQRIFRAEFHGSNSTGYVDADRESYFVADDGEPEPQSSQQLSLGIAPPEQELQPEHWLGFWHESKHFIDCVAAGQKPSSDFADAVKSMELAQRILLSTRDA